MQDTIFIQKPERFRNSSKFEFMFLNRYGNFEISCV